MSPDFQFDPAFTPEPPRPEMSVPPLTDLQRKLRSPDPTIRAAAQVACAELADTPERAAAFRHAVMQRLHQK